MGVTTPPPRSTAPTYTTDAIPLPLPVSDLLEDTRSPITIDKFEHDLHNLTQQQQLIYKADVTETSHRLNHSASPSDSTSSNDISHKTARIFN